MKLSQLIAAAAPGTDPEIRILDPWGEISPSVILDPRELIAGDPLIDDLATLGTGTLILHSEPA